eukprot:1136804-Pelagomonas_calceolata.AAC.3
MLISGQDTGNLHAYFRPCLFLVSCLFQIGMHAKSETECSRDVSMKLHKPSQHQIGLPEARLIEQSLHQHAPTAVAVIPEMTRRRGLGRFPPHTTVCAGSVKLGLLVPPTWFPGSCVQGTLLM